MWSAIGFALGAAFAIAAPTVQSAPVPVRAAIPFLGAACGAVLCDWMLQRAARRRMARITSELPTVLEFLTLSLTAGEGLLDAIRRVARTGSGSSPASSAGSLPRWARAYRSASRWPRSATGSTMPR
ncbi:hypothetical protein GCM10025870_30850 [Agromyces marinus]|uniref:Uncharacterized protein n=1 Tax=Agromyces marinus TaxID=1389020 RepID=A0ABM8H5I3_9MICO|nr:hypothetical protein GCM10025870_30850 [Agromyces marinus]